MTKPNEDIAGNQRDPLHEILHTGHRDTVAERLIPGGVRCAGEIRPSGRIPLEQLAFRRDQPANEQRPNDDQFVLSDILAVWPFVVAARQRPNRILICWLANQICCVLVLSGALRRDNIGFLEFIHPLSGEDRVVVCSGQGVGQLHLEADPVPTVLGLAVNGIAGDADGLRLLQHQTGVVPPGPHPGGHGRRNGQGAFVPGINAVVFKNERLMSMFLRPQRTGHILCAAHNAAPLIIQAEHRRHHAAAWRSLQCWSYFLLKADASRLAASSGGEARGIDQPAGVAATAAIRACQCRGGPFRCKDAGLLGIPGSKAFLRNEGLLFHPGLCAQSGGQIVEIPHLVPLVGGECHRPPECPHLVCRCP